MTSDDELRAEYRREAFDLMVRGNYAARLNAYSDITGQITSDGGDYTIERDELFKGMMLDDMIAGIKQRRERVDKQLYQGGY